jgi:hypothetical protein
VAGGRDPLEKMAAASEVNRKLAAVSEVNLAASEVSKRLFLFSPVN